MAVRRPTRPPLNTFAKPGSWAGRFTLAVQQLWRQLQDELRDNGASESALSLERSIRMPMGILVGKELPELQLHRASISDEVEAT